MTMTLTEKREARTAVAVRDDAAHAIENLLIKGDLKALTPEQRNTYYLRLCEATGLNPMTQPFEYLTLNNRLVLYAKKACTDQLRAINKISVVDMDQEEVEGIYSVTVKVQNAEGRTDMDIGSVNIAGKKGDDRANAIMKASTKAKRRATLSICGLGLLDETEVETIPAAVRESTAAPLAGEVDPSPHQPPRISSAQAKRDGVWEAFLETLHEFTDAAKCETWWLHPKTQAEVSAMPGTWMEQAQEAYDKHVEKLWNGA